MRKRNDAINLVRQAQTLYVDYRRAVGSPPNFSFHWSPLWGARVEKIVINYGATPSQAIISFPEMRWHEFLDCKLGDNIRIRNNCGTVVFMGFITKDSSGFSGGEASGTGECKAWESKFVIANSYLWLLNTTSVIYGQLARGIDDYDKDGDPIERYATFLSGRRAIFNPGNCPNKDNLDLDCWEFTTPLFIDVENAESNTVKFWTAKDMLRYVLSYYWNDVYKCWPISDDFDSSNSALSDSLDHPDWDKVLPDILIEGFHVVDAVALICRQLGWSFREDYSLNDNIPFLIFYKIGDQSTGWTVAHNLYAPAVGESIEESVSQGKKLCWSMNFTKDISQVVNNPLGLGDVHRFEFTAELVPGWDDLDLEPDISDLPAHLYLTEADLQHISDKNSEDYFKYYHPSGDSFQKDVGRKWVLNETGKYSDPRTYNRGPAFDLSSVIPSYYIEKHFQRLYAPFGRQLLPCLTLDKEGVKSIGIKVEFSFDKGENWQVIPCSIVSLPNELGIYIAEQNLAEIVDLKEGVIIKQEKEEGLLEGIQLNLWTSLCDDILNGRSFLGDEETGDWRTRVRITASVQMDQRLVYSSMPSVNSGSPFRHQEIYDLSGKYHLQKRTRSSIFEILEPELPICERDDTDALMENLDAIRSTNEDASASGQFMLERLWLGDSNDQRPDFMVGDCIKNIAGRECDLCANIGGQGKMIQIYPEIIQIIYHCQQQKMELITRDLRFAARISSFEK